MIGRLERGVIVAGIVAVVVIAVVVWIADAPVAWLLLGYASVVSLGALVVQAGRRRFFDPLTIIAAFAFVSFCLRALHLFLNANDVLSYYSTTDPFDQYLRVETSETARFVTQLVKEPLQPLLTRAIGTVAIFVTLVVVGYLLPWGPRLGRRLRRVGHATGGQMNVRAVVAVCLAIAVVGQAIILVKVGGPAAALRNSVHHTVLRAGLAEHFLIGFGVIGVLVWAAWSRPTSTRAGVALALATFEIVLFFAIGGSRTRVVLVLGMLAVVSNFLWRQWRAREVAGAVIAVVVLAAALLGIRQATLEKSTGEALKSAPTYITDPRGIINDLNEFDYLFMATTVIGSSHRFHEPAPFQYGNGFWQAVHPFVPGFIDSNKPESRDQEFRKIVWGSGAGEGRPYTAVGDFWNDFGWAGVVVGSLIFGLLSRAMLGLVSRDARGPGWEYRVIVFAMGLMLVYVGVSTTYSVTFGFLVIFGLPLVLTMYVLRPGIDWAGRRLATRARPAEKAPVP
jgi:hypothetical protein